jgi:hypothetical protein
MYYHAAICDLCAKEQVLTNGERVPPNWGELDMSQYRTQNNASTSVKSRHFVLCPPCFESRLEGLDNAARSTAEAVRAKLGERLGA